MTEEEWEAYQAKHRSTIIRAAGNIASGIISGSGNRYQNVPWFVYSDDELQRIANVSVKLANLIVRKSQ